jgi:hypothetical protein
LEHAKSDPEEPIYPGSLGSNRIFHMLKTTAGLASSPAYDLFVISIYTLLRNAYSKGITQAAIEKVVDDDVDLYMTFIGAYLSYRRQTPGAVLFYAPNYRSIPRELLRKTSGQRDEMDALYLKLLHKLPTKLTEITEDPLLRKYLVATSGGMFPHKELPGYIRDIYDGRRTHGMLGTIMLSHCPIDLHLARMIPGIELLESHTAAIYPPSEFGRKLTKDVRVPFNTATHRAFGDEVHLAALCKGRQKAELTELAAKRQWAIHTESEILTDIATAFPDVTRDDLLKLRL